MKMYIETVHLSNRCALIRVHYRPLAYGREPLNWDPGEWKVLGLPDGWEDLRVFRSLVDLWDHFARKFPGMESLHFADFWPGTGMREVRIGLPGGSRTHSFSAEESRLVAEAMSLVDTAVKEDFEIKIHEALHGGDPPGTANGGGR